MLFAVTAVVPRGDEREDRAGDALEGHGQAQVVPRDDLEAGYAEADDHGAEARGDERPDNPAPELVRHPDGEVPEGDAHHDPDEDAHRRPCFLLARCWRRRSARRAAAAASASADAPFPSPGDPLTSADAPFVTSAESSANCASPSASISSGSTT